MSNAVITADFHELRPHSKYTFENHIRTKLHYDSISDFPTRSPNHFRNTQHIKDTCVRWIHASVYPQFVLTPNHERRKTVCNTKSDPSSNVNQTCRCVRGSFWIAYEQLLHEILQRDSRPSERSGGSTSFMGESAQCGSERAEHFTLIQRCNSPCVWVAYSIYRRFCLAWSLISLSRVYLQLWAGWEGDITDERTRYI